MSAAQAVVAIALAFAITVAITAAPYVAAIALVLR